jgi:adenine deaminase
MGRNWKRGWLPAVDPCCVARHNVARLLKEGVCVTINSDDPAYFGGYVNENYRQIALGPGLGASQLLSMIRNSFEAAFMSEDARCAHLNALDGIERR